MRFLVVLLAVSLALGCTRRGERAAVEEPEAPDAHEAEGASHPEDASAEAAMVRIEPTMLRDLRVTTAAVEKRPGSESAPVVAELQVAFDALLAVLTWRQVVVLRACCKYLRQTGIAFSQRSVSRTACSLP